MSQKMRSAMDVVLDLIHPTEEAKVAIEVRSPFKPDDEAETWSGHSEDPALHRRRILAVVTHLHADGKHEHGCVFVLSERLQRVKTGPEEFILDYAFPIVGSFSITMSQPRRTIMTQKNAIGDPSTEMAIVINPGEDSPFAPIALQTKDLPGLRKVLDECKRLRDASSAEIEADYDFEPFGWVASYVADDSIPPLLSPIPPDLRTIKKPIHTRLTPARAGAPGNDFSDMELIREDWMRKKVEDELFAQSEKTMLRIRIGTFNVNGKMPSQDLSAWVRGQTERSASASVLIPPLKEISPLSMGEAQQHPVEKELEALDLNRKTAGPDAATTDASSTTTASDTARSATMSAGPTSEETAVSDSPVDVPEDESDPDMIVLGFQELDLSAEALLYSSTTVREDAWCMAAFAGLGEKAALYEKLVSKQLVGMLLVIIVKKRLRACFSEIKTCSVGTGIMGMLGNKGATAIRLLFTPMPPGAKAPEYEGKPTVLTFVNAHLAAFDEMFERRNADFHDLSKRLQFDSGIVADEAVAPGSGYGAATVQLSVFESDTLFWLVNLNYRILLPDADIRELLAAPEQMSDENINTLRRFDQLAFAMRNKKAFEDFIEQPLSHPPTYRFAAGVLTDKLGYDLKRKPAWTDRIMHMTSAAVSVKQTSYTSHPLITMSDHKPVSAGFDVKVPVLSVREYQEFIERLWRDVSGLEYVDERPRVRVSPTTIEFGSVFYKRPATKVLQIENIGNVPCSFRFVAKAPAADPCPRWLRMSATTGLVLPGEKAEISLTAYVGDALASHLNTGFPRLDETLVLHTALGRDHFVQATGAYKRTCFATSISWLVRLPGPVRELRFSGDLLPEERGVNAPREIMRLVNWLMSNATDVSGLFFERGDEELVQQIRESLDTGAEFAFDRHERDPKVALAFADALIQFLESLVEPVIPAALHARCAEMSSRDEAFEILEELPVVNVNVWISLTAFLHFIDQQEAYRDNLERLVALFTPILFRDDLSSLVPVSVVGKRNFLRYFIG
ncbi:DNase I-like protein [Trametes sanguinea]|nr:DNase I-like protein [Trametes sanguinea]